MAVLTGHSMPANVPVAGAVLDHTYVTCEGGHAWPCWGRSAGGNPLQSGDGSSARACFIAGSRSWAGIIYGVTGLCHQTANRILHPAGVTVSDAPGYAISRLFYGDYGSTPQEWAWRLRKYANEHGEMPGCVVEGTPKISPPGPESATLLGEVAALYERRGRVDAGQPDAELLGDLFELRVRYALTDPLSGIEDVRRILADFVESKSAWDAGLREGRITGLAFATGANELCNLALSRCADVIGADAYRALFEMEPGEFLVVVRPDVCAVVYDGADPNEIG